jgi:abortive infection bacteriophage resistance protein
MTLSEVIKNFEIEAEMSDSLMIPYESRKKYSDDCKQMAEWLKELKAYREILANADRIIESEYGCVILEGYADVLDKMNEVFKEVNADE